MGFATVMQKGRKAARTIAAGGVIALSSLLPMKEGRAQAQNWPPLQLSAGAVDGTVQNGKGSYRFVGSYDSARKVLSLQKFSVTIPIPAPDKAVSLFGDTSDANAQRMRLESFENAGDSSHRAVLVSSDERAKVWKLVAYETRSGSGITQISNSEDTLRLPNWTASFSAAPASGGAGERTATMTLTEDFRGQLVSVEKPLTVSLGGGRKFSIETVPEELISIASVKSYTDIVAAQPDPYVYNYTYSTNTWKNVLLVNVTVNSGDSLYNTHVAQLDGGGGYPWIQDGAGGRGNGQYISPLKMILNCVIVPYQGFLGWYQSDSTGVRTKQITDGKFHPIYSIASPGTWPAFVYFASKTKTSGPYGYQHRFGYSVGQVYMDYAYGTLFALNQNTSFKIWKFNEGNKRAGDTSYTLRFSSNRNKPWDDPTNVLTIDSSRLIVSKVTWRSGSVYDSIVARPSQVTDTLGFTFRVLDSVRAEISIGRMDRLASASVPYDTATPHHTPATPTLGSPHPNSIWLDPESMAYNVSLVPYGNRYHFVVASDSSLRKVRYDSTASSTTLNLPGMPAGNYWWTANAVHEWTDIGNTRRHAGEAPAPASFAVERSSGVSIGVLPNRPGLEVYPNPSTGEVFIRTDSDKPIRIIDRLGRAVATLKPAGGECQIDLLGWPNGPYYVVSGEKKVSFMKLE